MDAEDFRWDFFLAHAGPDIDSADALYDLLRTKSRVFLDSKCLLPGDNWDEALSEAQRTSFITVVLVSSRTGKAYFQREEIAAAIDLARRHPETHRVVPVFMDSSSAAEETVPYGLRIKHGLSVATLGGLPLVAQRLNDLLHHLVGPTTNLIVDGSESSIPTELALQKARHPGIVLPASAPTGTMSTQSQFYVERGKLDERALRLIKDRGVTISIQTAGQTGGSSLLRRMIDVARSVGKEVVEIDFTKVFDEADLKDRERFYKRFCAVLANRLNVPDRLNDFWKKELSTGDRCTRYLRYILQYTKRPLVLALDEVDRLLDTDFRSSFFAMLRTWHNDRCIEDNFENLDLVLVTSLEPHQLIDEPNQSPYNVGEVIKLPDFNLSEIEKLNEQYGSLLSPLQLTKLMDVLAGHPHLWQLGLYQVAMNVFGFDELLARVQDEDGPFGRHLSGWYSWLRGRERLRAALIEALVHDDTSEQEFLVLRKKGLVNRKNGRIVARCPLYKSYFTEHFNVK